MHFSLRVSSSLLKCLILTVLSGRALWRLLIHANSQERTRSLNTKVWGGYPGGRPDPRTFTPVARSAGKQSLACTSFLSRRRGRARPEGVSSEEENPPEKVHPKIKSSFEQVFLNNFRWVPDLRYGEEGKSSRELFEKVRVNAVFFFGISGFGVGFGASISEKLYAGELRADFFVPSTQERESSPKRKFSFRIPCGRPEVIRADVRGQKVWYSAKRAGVNQACLNKVMAHMWFIHDAHLGPAFLFLDLFCLHIYIAVNDSHGYSMSQVRSWHEVDDVLRQVSSSPFGTRPF